jgi:hypothetical protein
LEEFVQRFTGKTYNEIMRGKKRFLWLDWETIIADPEFQFVVDPLNPENEIDMIHFLVVGQLGLIYGYLNELQQYGSKSAFYPQDLRSNSLGIKFYNNYWEKIRTNPTEIVNYIQEFLTNKELRSEILLPATTRYRK